MNFNEETKYDREKLNSGNLNWNNKPELYKIYQTHEIIKLPKPTNLSSKTFFELIKSRQSIRKYKKKEINLEQLSYLLWCSYGVQRTEFDFEFRTIPSAGALYPLEIYFFANNIHELEKGFYHYNIKNHFLEVIRKGDFLREIIFGCLHQNFIANSSLIIFITAIFERMFWKYKERGLRYIFIEAGHLMQNFLLAAHSIELGTCQIGAFFDDELNELLNLDGNNDSVIYVSSLGYPD